VKIIGITGGIGSGKSTVCAIFSALGFPVFEADKEAKWVYDEPEIRKEVIELFGKEIFENAELNKNKLAQIVFNNPEKLAKLNAIIHPAVRARFSKWCRERRNHPIVFREAAILFESGTYADCHSTVLVIAPEEMRIANVMKRDGLTKQEVLDRMNNQWSDEKKRSLATFVIENDGKNALLPQCLTLVKRLSE